MGCINLHLSLVLYQVSALTKSSDKKFGVMPFKILYNSIIKHLKAYILNESNPEFSKSSL